MDVLWTKVCKSCYWSAILIKLARTCVVCLYGLLRSTKILGRVYYQHRPEPPQELDMK